MLFHNPKKFEKKKKELEKEKLWRRIYRSVDYTFIINVKSDPRKLINLVISRSEMHFDERELIKMIMIYQIFVYFY